MESGGDRPAGALRRRPRAGRRRRCRRASTQHAGPRRHRRLGPGRASPAAADLLRYGCEVTVYEALHVVGGVLRYGIPSFRLPRDIIEREVQRLRDMGVQLRDQQGRSARPSPSPSCKEEMGYDAVFVGAGAGAPSFLGIPGEFAGQVYSANEFLTRVNLMGGDKFPYLDTPDRPGQERRRHRRRQHRHGLPARCQAAGRARPSAASTAARKRRRRRASRSCATPRRRASSSSSCTRRSRSMTDEGGRRPRHAGGEDDAGRAGREGPAQAGAARRVRRTRLRHGDLCARHQRQPDRRPGDARPRPQQMGLHRRRRGDAGHQPAGRVRRRRHRHRRRHGDPGDGRRPPRGQGDRRLPAERQAQVADQPRGRSRHSCRRRRCTTAV